MNRQQRRAAKKAAPRKKPGWHKLTREERKEALFRNGITDKDLAKEFDLGYKAARKDLTRYTMAFFYSAIAISTHRLYGFGYERVRRLLEDVQQIMTEEITREDIIDRCYRETGIQVIEEGFDN